MEGSKGGKIGTTAIVIINNIQFLKTIKLLEGNKGKNLQDLELGKECLDMIPKHDPSKKKSGQLDFMKTKNFAL